VDDLNRTMAFYQKLGFTFDEPWEGFYAIGNLTARNSLEGAAQWTKLNVGRAARMSTIDAAPAWMASSDSTAVLTPVA
jgi:hypothetical protein